jgi:acyl-CoA thioester hydrolase
MRFHVPEKKKLVYEMTIPIRWGDMDAMGHINNTLYFRYMETARIDWCQSVGIVPEAEGGQGIVIVNAYCTFRQQLRYPGDVLVRMYTTDVGRSSFGTYVTMERADQPGPIWADGGAKMVWTDYTTEKSMPLPDWLLEKIA